MPKPKKTAKNLEAAFREAGFDRVDAGPDCVRVWLGQDHEIEVRPISAGHGRPQEVRNALAHPFEQSAPCVAATYVATHFTTGAMDILRETGVNYLDDRQFVFRNQEPFVAIRQDRTVGRDAKPTTGVGLGGKAGIAVQEMLLDDREWWRVTDLAREADVAAGTAQTALKRLEQLELIEVEGSGPRKRRRIVDKGEVLDRWVEEAGRERHRLLTTFIHTQGPVDLARRISGSLSGAGIDHAITGACAALLVAPHVTDVRRCEVWVGPAVGQAAVVNALGAEPVEKGGNVTVFQARNDAPLFAHRTVEGVQVANPLRLYADLLDDPRRGEEQAEFLRGTVLKM
ncbi:MAG: hypothetical protein Q8K99_14840 [Actinomycetota bacterium]|nr:hypothetical protein [Actinomycetota bacterium]